MVKDPDLASSEDMAFVYGKDPETDNFHILRKRGEALEAGTMRQLEDGKAVAGEVVSLQPRAEHPCLFNVTPVGKDTAPIAEEKGSRTGPARVANARFRHGWDHIWGGDDDGDILH